MPFGSEVCFSTLGNAFSKNANLLGFDKHYSLQRVAAIMRAVLIWFMFLSCRQAGFKYTKLFITILLTRTNTACIIGAVVNCSYPSMFFDSPDVKQSTQLLLEGQ